MDRFCTGGDFHILCGKPEPEFKNSFQHKPLGSVPHFSGRWVRRFAVDSRQWLRSNTLFAFCDRTRQAICTAMIHDPFIVPPLPADWPFEPGIPLRPLGCRLNLALPGFGSGWRVCTPGGIVPSGEPAPLPGAFGRGGLLCVGDMILRPYRRGGFLRHFNERTYRSHLRFAAEHAVHRGLWEAGFPTVEPLGYAWRPSGLGVEGVLITRRAEGEPWPRRWDLSAERAAAIRLAVDSLCTWGLWSPDLNATNIILPPQGGALLLDWDRASFEPPDVDLWPRYRARLGRSLTKLGAPAETLDLIGSASHR